MSFIHLPDPHPGRCENYRSKVHSDSFVEAVRCLEYENQRHVCQFPEFSHVVADIGSYSISSQQVVPTPWVRP